MTMTQHEFDSRDALTDALAGELLGRLKADIETNGEAGLAVSGGRTPVALFQALSQADLDWSKVTVTLVDERWVSPDHDDSNEKLVRTHLLQNKAARARFIPHKTAAESPFEADQTLILSPNVVHQICNTGDEDLHILATLAMAPVAVETGSGEPLPLPWD